MGSLLRVRLVLLIAFLFASFTAFAQCAPSGVAGTVNICTPAAGSTVASPVSFQAAATPPSGQTITAMRLYVDSVAQYNSSSNTLSTSLTLSAGNHNVTVNAWTNTGAVQQMKEAITVTSTAVSVTVTPASTSIATNGTAQFSATVQNSSNQSVTWEVDSVAGGSSTTGTISSTGLYTAPATAGTHTITAVSAADTTKSGNATVTVNAPGSCSPTSGVVTICAPAAGATVSSPVSFQAVAGAPSGQKITAMKLYIDSVSVASSTGGSMNTTQTVANGTHNIVINAWTNTGTVIQGKESITVGGSTSPSVTVSPGSATLAPSGTQQFTANVQNESSNNVNWSVDGVAGGNSTVGTIDATGLYTAPTTTGSHTITATSSVDSATSGHATVNVTSGSACNPTPNAVTICAPAAGATVNSPVTFTAVAGPPSGQTINAMRLYIDSVSIVTENGGSFSTTQNVAAGTHNIVINAWPSGGGTLQGQETITVTAGTTPSVSVTPGTASVIVNGTQQFTATVQNESSNTVNWSVDGVAGGSATAGTISASGLYTAPGTTGSHTVTATSAADNTTSGSATVTVTSSTPPPSSGGVFTYMYNNARTGANTNETILTPAVVTNGANFGKKGSWSLDASIYTEPLYVSGVTINGAVHNVVYVGTENDSVYALDADHPGTVLWKKSFLTSTATIGTGYTGGRTSIGGNVGITGTPVIDPNTNRLYVVARTTENGNNTQRIHAIDIRSGAEVVPNVLIQGSVPGTGMGNNGAGVLPFSADTESQRPGLVLVNGVVYVTFASFSDLDPYHGWVFAFDASNLSILGVYNSTPNGGGGGFWAAGAAPAADDSGNIYVATANGRPDATALFDPPTDLPNSLLKLKLANGKLSLVDYFAPYNTRCLSADDLDLGSSAPSLIPDQFGGMNLIALGSKEGRAYLVNRDNMGHFQTGSDSQIPSSVLFNPNGACGSANFDANAPWRVYGTPAYWNGSIYFGSAFGPLRQYNITSGKLVQKALGTHTYAASGQAGRGPLTVVSANGNTNGIVWTLENDLNGNGWLRAYDAQNVANELYNSNFGGGSNFVIPTVINGKVFVSGHNILYEYGKLN